MNANYLSIYRTLLSLATLATQVPTKGDLADPATMVSMPSSPGERLAMRWGIEYLFPADLNGLGPNVARPLVRHS